MLVTSDTEAEYINYFQGQVDRLNCLDKQFPNDKLLWHYTTGESLLNIVRSGALYATQVSCLNDTTEIRYGSKLLRDAFLALQNLGRSLEEQQLLESLVKALLDDPATPSHAPSAWFVACFTEERDDLSQWRAYSGGENGYSIGFLAQALIGRSNYLARVNYEHKLHQDVAADVAETALKFFSTGLEKNKSAAEQWTQDFLSVWGKWVGRIGPMVKDEAFKAEKEFRIIHELQEQERGHIEFSQKKTLLARHLPLSFPPFTSVRLNVLPISHIVVGPSRHKEITAVSVRTLMQNSGYVNCIVSCSEAPFQLT